MVEFLSSWAGGIAVTVIIATILEMLLPDGKNRKYIKTVIGIYILFAVLEQPLTEPIELENIFGGYEIQPLEVASINAENSIEEVYIYNLKTDMASKLKEIGYEVLEIKLNENKIKLLVKRLEKSKIKKVEIGNKQEVLTNSEINEIKEYLSTTYDIQKRNIIVGG